MNIRQVEGRYAAISNRLRALREYYEMSSKDFAEQAEVSAKSYSQWESGDFRVSIDGALKIQSRYGVSLDFIYTGRLEALPNKMAIALASNPLLKNSSASTVSPET